MPKRFPLIRFVCRPRLEFNIYSEIFLINFKKDFVVFSRCSAFCCRLRNFTSLSVNAFYSRAVEEATRARDTTTVLVKCVNRYAVAAKN